MWDFGWRIREVFVLRFNILDIFFIIIFEKDGKKNLKLKSVG